MKRKGVAAARPAKGRAAAARDGTNEAIRDLREALYLESRRTQDAVKASRAAVREYTRMRSDIALIEHKVEALAERVRQPRLPF